jgi:hypothetical protein
MGVSEAEAFSERMKRELLALESANVHAILETESVVDEVRTCPMHYVACLFFLLYSITIDTKMQCSVQCLFTMHSGDRYYEV